MTRNQLFGIFSLIILFVIASSSMQLFENVDAKEICVIQSPISGKLSWYTTEGLQWQGFGKVTKYAKSAQYWFTANKSEDQSIPTTFNDGGVGRISGSIRYDLPLDEENLNEIHRKYGSREAVERELIRSVMDRSIFVSGPTMSSTESYAIRRSELINIIEDQAALGIYKTKTTESREKDIITQQEKTIKIVELINDPKAPKGIARQETSPCAELGVKLYAISIDNIYYSDSVIAQISQQRDMTMKTATQAAEAKMAEQRKLTNEQNGMANAAEAKWKMEAQKVAEETEAEKRKQVAIKEAEQKREVAKLDREAAEHYKQAQILRGEGDAAYKQKVMAADGALAQKLATLENIARVNANAISNYKGNLVPQTIIGGEKTGSGANASVNGLLDMMLVNYAKMLNVDISVKKD